MTPLARRLIDHAALSGPFEVSRFIYPETKDEQRLHRLKPKDWQKHVTDALKVLSRMCDEVVRDGQILWMMNDSDRTDVLRDLARRARQDDRARCWRMRPPLQADVFGRVLRACLTGRRPLEAATLAEAGDSGDAAENIRAAIAAAVFAAPCVEKGRAEKIAEFETRLYRRSVALAEEARRRAALPHGLIGRRAERAEVMAFLDAPAAPGESGHVPRLLLTAPRGMGKSAFLADLMQRLEAEGRWVIHFDFDRVTLARGGPVAWVEEMTRQIGDQVPAVSSALSTVRSRHAERRQNAFEPGLAPAPDSLLEESLAALADVERAPVVVVLDTVEQVIDQDGPEEFRADPDHTLLLQLLAWVDRLAPLGPARAPGEAPGVAVIVAAAEAPAVSDEVMRAWFDHVLPLGPLTPEDAAAFLAAHDPSLDAAMRQSIVAAVGGVPLRLILTAKQLAGQDAEAAGKLLASLRDADLAAKPQDEALASLELSSLDWLDLKDLPLGLTAEHIRALVKPTLLLRDVTEEDLVHVVAPTVGVDLSDPSRARAAFEALGRQHWLMESTFGGGRLRQLPSVRRAMLPYMLDDDGDMSARVLAAGIAHHEPDPAHPDPEAAYLRALSGETDWFFEHPEMARSVAASAGADFEVMQPAVRAILKYLAPDVRGMLGSDEIAALPGTLAEHLPAPRRSAILDRSFGAPAPAQPSPAAARTEATGDAYELLNDPRIHAEADDAFVAADWPRVAEIGWSTLRRMQRWPDMGRALGARGPFRDHWLWRLAVVSTLVEAPTDWAELGPLGEILRCEHPAFPKQGPYPDPLSHTAPAVFDFDLFCGMVSGGDFSKAIEPSAILEIRVGGILRGHRVLGGSRWVRRLAMQRGIEQVTFERIDQIPLYHKVFFPDPPAEAGGARQGTHVIPWVAEALAGRTTSPQHVQRRLWPGGNLEDLARRNVMIRGQTPELHRALARSILAEGAAAALRDQLEKLSDELRDPGARAILAELASSRSGRDEEELIRAVLHRADYCGLLPQLVARLSSTHAGGRLSAIAKLFAALDRRWTWPPAPAI